ncbi:iron chelate uptake ABC transporter family permease subunit [Brachybacterium sp. FME24]|uniref:iron chelate uptake ABC transporter family permease subunit n=1 Tax=Brachybacterium sp. FME24 TaxID=2742605 RepID=UPI0018664B75
MIPSTTCRWSLNGRERPLTCGISGAIRAHCSSLNSERRLTRPASRARAAQLGRHALADLVGRIVLAPRELPVGVITALIGVPAFLIVLRRKERT